MRLIRAFFKLVLLGFFSLIAIGVALYFIYKPLIDFIVDPGAYAQTNTQQSSQSDIPSWLKQLPNESVPKEAKPYEGKARARAESEISKIKSLPPGSRLAYVQKLIGEARRCLDKASIKLAQARPQDPKKQAKIQKAQQLLPKAYQLLNQIESSLTHLNSIQDKLLTWYESIRSKF